MKRRDILKALGFSTVAPSFLKSMIIDESATIIKSTALVEDCLSKTLNGKPLLSLYYKNKIFATGNDAELIIKKIEGLRYAYINFNGLSSIDKVWEIAEDDSEIKIKFIDQNRGFQCNGFFTDLAIISSGIYEEPNIEGTITISGEILILS